MTEGGGREERLDETTQRLHCSEGGMGGEQRTRDVQWEVGGGQAGRVVTQAQAGAGQGMSGRRTCDEQWC